MSACPDRARGDGRCDGQSTSTSDRECDKRGIMSMLPPGLDAFVRDQVAAVALASGLAEAAARRSAEGGVRDAAARAAE